MIFEKTKQSNLPLPDQLDELRDQIKVLKAREKEFSKQLKLRGGERGAFVEAIVQTVPSKRLNTEKVKAELGERVEDFYDHIEVTKVLLREIDPE
jgi:predicted phage-related endonuclease